MLNTREMSSIGSWTDERITLMVSTSISSSQQARLEVTTRGGTDDIPMKVSC
jgi:hypothetical protein